MRVGATFPVPRDLIDRIFEGKDVFVKPKTLGKIEPGMKIVFYASREDQGFYGEAEVVSVEEFSDPMEILKKYGERVFLSEKELKEYVKNREKWGSKHRPWMAIVIKNAKKYPRIVKPRRFVSVSGRYLSKEEYERILKEAEGIER